MSHRVEFLYFDECPSHVAARELLDEAIAAIAPGTPVEVINATDPEVASAHRFPGTDDPRGWPGRDA